LLSQTAVASVRVVDAARATDAPPPLDHESRTWLADLTGPPGSRDAAAARLHAYLLRVARFELARRARARGAVLDDADDLAMQAADDALMAIMRKITTYRGESRFTTWAAKFAILEAASKARVRAWQNAEVVLDPDGWQRFAAQADSERSLEQAQQLHEVAEAIRTQLTPHQREILVAVTLDGVPIDVLADRLRSTRGAIYKTLHDARRALRTYLFEQEAS